jgi:hypothetical protein
MKRIAAPFLVAVLSLSGTAQAEIVVAASLEWLADHCVDSGVYIVSAVRENQAKDGVELSLTLKRALRGTPARQTKQGYYKTQLSDEKRALVQKGDTFLICFQHHSTGEKRAVQTVNLDNPQVAGHSLIAVSRELKLLTSKKEILKVFEDRLAKHPKVDPVEIGDHSKDNRFEVRPPTEVFRAIWGGSSCYLKVPQDLLAKVKLQVYLDNVASCFHDAVTRLQREPPPDDFALFLRRAARKASSPDDGVRTGDFRKLRWDATGSRLLSPKGAEIQCRIAKREHDQYDDGASRFLTYEFFTTRSVVTAKTTIESSMRSRRHDKGM